jgi:transcriptional regulator with XRE-family HTH domain
MGLKKERVKMRNLAGAAAVATEAARERSTSMNLRELGERLKRARVARGLTQEELGFAVGVSRAAVSQWEAGQVEATLSKLHAACERLQVNLGRVVLGDIDLPEGPAGRRRMAEGVVTELLDQAEVGSAQSPEWWRIPPAVLRDLLCSPTAAKIFQVRVASMEPTINRGAYVLIDISQNTPHDGQVYVINNGISLVLKRLHVRRDKNKSLVDLSADGSPRVTTLPIARVKIVGRVIAQLARPI